MDLLVVTALALGATHCFAPDHVAAVGVYAVRAPSARAAARDAAGWGVGHALTILVLGAVLALSGIAVPDWLEARLEAAVGIALIVLGLATMLRRRRPTDDDDPRNHHHARPVLLGIGMLHGLAGTGAVAAAAPVAADGSSASSLLYLGCFGVGTIVAMALCGACMAAVSATAGARLRRTRVLAATASMASVVVGALWVAGAVAR